jgi:hypothetical protein
MFLKNILTFLGGKEIFYTICFEKYFHEMGRIHPKK